MYELAMRCKFSIIGRYNIHIFRSSFLLSSLKVSQLSSSKWLKGRLNVDLVQHLSHSQNLLLSLRCNLNSLLVSPEQFLLLLWCTQPLHNIHSIKFWLIFKFLLQIRQISQSVSEGKWAGGGAVEEKNMKIKSVMWS